MWLRLVNCCECPGKEVALPVLRTEFGPPSMLPRPSPSCDDEEEEEEEGMRTEGAVMEAGACASGDDGVLWLPPAPGAVEAAFPEPVPVAGRLGVPGLRGIGAKKTPVVPAAAEVVVLALLLVA